ncbi:MAG: DNA-binding transcriptional MocR family regulator [Acidimicrobiales bacterium]|jgi:DNA-binding transcriptional MocR family regulator
MERLGTKALLTTLGDWGKETTSLQAGLVAAFRSAITSGDLQPGTVLPAERTLARALGVSRSTVTASLAELKRLEVLVARHGSGTVVAGGDGAIARSVLEPIDLASSSPADSQSLPDVEVDVDALLRAGSGQGHFPAGLAELRDAVAARFTEDGVDSVGAEVLITNGAQHAMALAFAHLTQPGDRVIVDEPTYPGVVDLLAARGLVAVPLPRIAGAIELAGLRRLAIESGATVAYLQTSVHNPTGFVATDDDLNQLAKLIDELGLTVVEDLVLADLRFDGSRPRPVAARVSSATVVVVGSVSKLGWGGLRIGWLRAPEQMVAELIRTRLADDLGSSVPSQVISVAVLNDFDVIVDSRQRTLARRANLARDQIADRCPHWTVHEPGGGLSLWIDLHHDATDLTEAARQAGVIVATGLIASVVGGEGPARHLRLCFDRPESRLVEGLDRLITADQTYQSRLKQR